MNPPVKPIGLVVCMATKKAISDETLLCLTHHLDGHPHMFKLAIRKPFEDAKNELTRTAYDLDADTLEFDQRYVFFVDDDAWWRAGHISRAIATLEANTDIW